ITLTNKIAVTNGTVLVLDGNGHSVTLSGGGAVQLFEVGVGAQVTLKKLTLVDGNGSLGGAVRNSGTFEAQDCTFAGNRAFILGGAIDNARKMTLNAGTFLTNSAILSFGGGGAIHQQPSDATLLITNCTFVGNAAAPRGAALYVTAGTAWVVNSTI